jgi:hypothetical protein
MGKQGNTLSEDAINRILKVHKENPELNSTQLGKRFDLSDKTIRRIIINSEGVNKCL